MTADPRAHGAPSPDAYIKFLEDAVLSGEQFSADIQASQRKGYSPRALFAAADAVRRRRAGQGWRPQMDWTPKDAEAASQEGWGIFDNSDYGMRIERDDERGRFDCDAAAIAYVGVRAMRGNPLACKALVELAHYHAVLDAAEG